MRDIRAFAEAWIEAWNSHDLDRVLGHYTTNARVISPMAKIRMPGSEGVVVGRKALANYWGPVLGPDSVIRFTLVDVLATVDGATILYRNQREQFVAETVRWNRDGLVTEAIVSYGAEPQPPATTAPAS